MDLISELLSGDPYPAYAAVRRHAPVHWNPPGVWMVLGYGEVRAVLRDVATFAQTPPAVPPVASAGSGEPDGVDCPDGVEGPGGGDAAVAVELFLQPARNTRLRRLVAEAMSPELAAVLSDGVSADARALVDRLAVRLAAGDPNAGGSGAGAGGRPGPGRPGGTVDLVAELATVVPVATLARLVGARVAGGPRLLAWAERTDDLVDLGGMGGDPLGLEGAPGPAAAGAALRAASELQAYADTLVSGREQFGPSADGDAVDALMAVRAADPTLSRPELVATVMTLLTAGHSATVRLLGLGMLALLRHPDQLARLVDGSVTPASAAEELLRYDAPVQLQRRVATRDTDLGGRRISAGQVVLAVLPAANRDPDAFADPDHLDLGRVDVGRDAVGHLGFGAGAGQCVGAALARLQLAAVLVAVAERLPAITLAGGHPVWRTTGSVRALAALPVTVAPAAVESPVPPIAGRAKPAAPAGPAATPVGARPAVGAPGPGAPRA